MVDENIEPLESCKSRPIPAGESELMNDAPKLNFKDLIGREGGGEGWEPRQKEDINQGRRRVEVETMEGS